MDDRELAIIVGGFPGFLVSQGLTRARQCYVVFNNGDRTTRSFDLNLSIVLYCGN